MKTIIIDSRTFKVEVMPSGVIITDTQSGLTKTITKQVSISSLATLRIIVRKQFREII